MGHRSEWRDELSSGSHGYVVGSREELICESISGGGRSQQWAQQPLQHEGVWRGCHMARVGGFLETSPPFDPQANMR